MLPPGGDSAPGSAVRRPGERRVVTVVFADVVGFTKLSEKIDPEVLTDVMDRMFDGIGTVVRRYEGTVDKFIGDAAMVLFGAPVAHEDDAERAVLTARGMMALLPDLNAECLRLHGLDPALALHIGIATGLVVAGNVGTRAGGGYTVMGDAVNLAARLVDLAAPTEILISDSTKRLVRGRIRSEWARSVLVKGKEEPVNVHRVLGHDNLANEPRGSAEFESPLVGRDADLAAVRQALKLLENGGGGLLFVEGPAGVGKSRLVRESLIDAIRKTTAFDVHTGRCISYGQSIPYYPFGRIIESLLIDAPAAWEDGAPDGALEALRQVSTGDFGNRAAPEAERHRLVVFESVSHLIEQRAATKPQVVVFEDMHWCDVTSLELLVSLLSIVTRTPVLMLVLSRPVGDEAVGRLRAASTSVARLSLRPLPQADTARLVEHLTADIQGFDDRLRVEIVARSAGIPLFVEEILRSYVDEGILTRDGSWTFDKTRSASALSSVPTTLHGLLSAKIDRLPEPQRARLQLASVIGKDFDPRLVDDLLGFPHEEAPWARLEATGEIGAMRSPKGPLRYRFAHVLTQEVIYATLLRSHRQELHRSAAIALEAQESSVDEHLHSLAWHFERAGVPEKASQYWLRAARHAVSAFANTEALDLFDRAIATAPHLAREALVEKEQLLQWMGKNVAAAAVIDELVDLARSRRDVADEADMLSRRAYIAYVTGDGLGIDVFAERALEAARMSGSPRVIARALRQVGIGHEFAGRFRDAELAYQELLSIEEPDAESTLTAPTYSSLGDIARTSDRFEEAIAWYEKSRARQPAGGSTPTRSQLTYLNNTGAAWLGLGDFARADGLLDQCISERTRMGYLSHMSESYFYRGLARLGMGHLDAAARDGADALRLAQEHGEVEMLGLALRLAALVRKAGGEAILGAPADTEAALRESVRVLQFASKPAEEARSRWELARVLKRRGREAEAKDEFDRAHQTFLRLGIPRAATKVARDRDGTGSPSIAPP